MTFELRYGEYTVAEYEAPEGYVLDDTPYAFSITEDGQTLSVDMSNTKITGKLVISKVDADTQKLLPDAGFRIYAADGKTVLMEGRTDKKGVCEFELEFGKYFYQEFDAPDGYKIDDTKYEFSITEDGKIISVVMTNQAEERRRILSLLKHLSLMIQSLLSLLQMVLRPAMMPISANGSVLRL